MTHDLGLCNWLLTAAACFAAQLGTLAARAEVPAAVLEAESARVAVVERASAATVAVMASNGQGGGSGVIISPDGYALSNFHVTREAGDAMKCGLDDGNLYDAVIVGLDPTGDVALIKLLGREDFPYARMADSDLVRAGDWCFTIGNPFLLATDFRPSVAYGIISGVHRYQYPAGTLLEYADCIQADAAINPGNSGGPMFDAAGRLIGINGRGSFEKRGRVNVGVGYAISINQIKNFLGHLKSGRLVDHATLGARASTGEDGRVLVEDILEESDAYRRGLRYGDEIIRFGGRSITSANSLKNALGIYPKGWRVPLSYVRDGKRYETFVRLRGVHRTAELEALLAGNPLEGRGPKPDPRNPKQPPGREPHHPEAPPAPGKADPKQPPMPEIAKRHFQAKRGFVNYHFNAVHQERVWKSLMTRGDYGSLPGRWIASGKLAEGGEFRFELTDKRAAIEMPGGKLHLDLEGDLSMTLSPPGSGGLLAALGLWRRMLALAPSQAGDMIYAGTYPMPDQHGLFDALEVSRGGVECRFLVDAEQGQLAALEMFPEEDTDPCEVYFSDYREVEGRMLPHRLEVRSGDVPYHVFVCDRWDFEPREKSR